MLRSMPEDDDTGVSIDHMIATYAPRYGGEDAVRSAVHNLVNEGHLYSTIDDLHFKFTG